MVTRHLPRHEEETCVCVDRHGARTHDHDLTAVLMFAIGAVFLCLCVEL